jgi:chemotaxis protein MotB
MYKKNFLSLLLVVLSITSVVSCVSKKKYLQSQSALEVLRKDSTELAAKVVAQQGIITSLTETGTSLQENIDRLKQQLDNTSKEAVNKIASQQVLLNKSREELTMQQKKLDAIQAVLEQQYISPLLLKEKVSEAFAGITSDQLSITTKNGKVLISTPQHLFFAQGSSSMNVKAKEALSKLASLLHAEPDIKINIDAFTDSLSVNTLFANTFDLCHARTTYLVKFLTAEQKVSAQRIVAAEPLFYHKSENEKPVEGTQGSQITMITLTPRFYQFYDLVNGR